jgi:alkylated DNA repair protein (DNA oxidative demethylase)
VSSPWRRGSFFLAWQQRYTGRLSCLLGRHLMIQSDLDLFGPQPQRLASHTVLLPGFALGEIEALLDALRPVLRARRHMHTPGGQRMAVALSNCGALGWVSDERGYRYSPLDPQRPALAAPRYCWHWPRAAALAGFEGFVPDACLINHYLPGTRLSLHQDRDERDFGQPIVSVSLGLPAVFLFGGLQRGDRAQRIALNHGDVLVWGGETACAFTACCRSSPACIHGWGAAHQPDLAQGGVRT